MSRTVIANKISFGHHAFHKRRVFVNIRRCDKESRMHMLLFQCIKDSFCVSILISLIKREIKHLGSRVPNVIGTVLFN